MQRVDPIIWYLKSNFTGLLDSLRLLKIGLRTHFSTVVFKGFGPAPMKDNGYYWLQK